MKIRHFFALCVLASLFIGQGYTTIYAQQPAPQPAQQPAQPALSPTPALPSVPATAPENAPAKVLLAEGTEVQLAFDTTLRSRSASDGDQVQFHLTQDLKVGDVVVAKAGCVAMGEVANARKSGMMGKGGELNVQLNYLMVGSVKVPLRGTKAKGGNRGVAGTATVTALGGVTGLLKKGNEVKISKGTALTAYVSENISLEPAL